MKSKVRFGILGAFVALAGAFGTITSHKAVEQVDAQVPAGFLVTKTCGALNITIGGTTTCTVVVTATAAVNFPEPLVLTVSNGSVSGTGTNPEFGRVLLLAGTSGAAGVDVDSVAVSNPVNGLNQTITVGCTGVTCDFAVGDTITITEAIRGAVGGPTTETLRFGAGVPVTLAPSVTVSPATVTATVTCTGGTPPIGTIAAGSSAAGSSSCFVDLNDNDLFPNVVSSGTVIVTVIGPAGVVLQSTGTTSGSFNCGGALNSPQSCDGVTVVLQSTTGSTAGGPVTLQITYAPDLPAVDQPIVILTGTVVNVTAVPPPPPPAPATAIAATSSCTPGLGGIAGVGAIIAGSGTPGQTTCTITFSDTDGVPAAIASGNFSVSAVGVTGVVIATPTFTGQTVQIRCGVVNAAEGCTTISVVLLSTTGSTSIGNVGLQLNYVSDVPAVNPSTVLNLNNVAQVSLTATTFTAFRQPESIRITCTSTSLGDPANGLPALTVPTPSQISALNFIAVGVLPGVVRCVAEPIVGGVVVAVAPGTFEVSATAGGLQTGTGASTTDLRIGCDNIIPAAVQGTTIDLNTCVGVAFNVFGAGVGTTEIRVRYEPSSVATLAGIQERESRANIAFVAPLVTVSLLLNPNPITAATSIAGGIAVGGASNTGVATARFNRTANCSFIFGQSIQGGSACIDPTTGVPILFNFGSTLNGNVLFTIDNTAVAVWNDSQSSTGATLSQPQFQGFISTSNQVTRRCGFFPTLGLPSGISFVPSSGPLASFFGGCESTTATYRGVLPGVTNVTATFIPDLPGAFGSALGVSGNIASLLGQFSSQPGTFAQSTRVLEVVAPALSGAVALSRGCNNVSPTVSEAAAAYAARVTPAASLVAIWEHQAASNTFRGFSPQAGAPSDLAAVTRLRPVFVCVSGAANLDQPAA